MKLKSILLNTTVVIAVCTGSMATAQQPSPAYFKSGNSVYQATPTGPAHTQPVYFDAGPTGAPMAPTRPVYQAPARPVYQTPVPYAPAMNYAVPVEDDTEDGYYWFWGQKWPGLALGPKIGTTGIGLEITMGVNDYLNLRGGFDYGSFSLGMELGNVDYDLSLTMISIPVLLDIHPFGGSFRITGGLFIQPGTKADLDATPTKPIQIGSHTYAPDVVGTLNGKIEASNPLAPYLGIGFGNSVGADKLLSLALDIGVIFQSYDVTLDSDGAGMTTLLSTFRDDIKKEEALIQKDVDGWKIYPVIAVSLTWHF